MGVEGTLGMGREDTGAAGPCQLQRTTQGYLGLWLLARAAASDDNSDPAASP